MRNGTQCNESEFRDEPQRFTLEITAKRSPTNEVEGTLWLDPEDFANFLRERFTVAESAEYGLDAYNKDSGQIILKIEVTK